MEDPYNLYFTPDGRAAIVVAEKQKRLDFRDPHTMALQQSLPTPECSGVNHADFSIDGRFAIFTCEFCGGGLIKVDMVNHKVLGHLNLSRPGMPQDIRIAPDGRVFYVADMHADGVFLVDGGAFKEIGFIRTGIGAHGLYPSRDGTKLYVANRGSHSTQGRPHGKGSIAVIDSRPTRSSTSGRSPAAAVPTWVMSAPMASSCGCPGGWDNVVYDIDTTTGAENRAGRIEPHELTVWPQPGRYSLGHTGNMR